MAAGVLAWSLAQAMAPPASAAPDETLDQSVCRIIDGAVRLHHVPASFLTRLIWQESSFRPGVVSRAGAQGVAQFMPGTAKERGLLDPFDPEQAIPAAAGFIADLQRRFGNLGLAAAAYNGGPARVAEWIAGRGGLPAETRDYVTKVTGRPVDDWLADRNASAPSAAEERTEECLTIVVSLKRDRGAVSIIAAGATAPWGVQLAGNFSKAAALASFGRARLQLAAVLGDQQPMVIGTRLRYRGTQTFYRVRVPAQTRGEANGVCGRVRAAGGACAVLRS